jgi:hypothetical protein
MYISRSGLAAMPAHVMGGRSGGWRMRWRVCDTDIGGSKREGWRLAPEHLVHLHGRGIVNTLSQNRRGCVVA